VWLNRALVLVIDGTYDCGAVDGRDVLGRGVAPVPCAVKDAAHGRIGDIVIGVGGGGRRHDQDHDRRGRREPA